MSKSRLCGAVFLTWSLFVFGCAAPSKNIAVSRESIQPGSSVTVRGEPHALLGTPLAVGSRLPSVKLVDAMTMRDVDLSELRGSVLFLSIVPSIDTKVCEAQTHYLGEEGDSMGRGILRVTISRDTPFAQKRFAEEAHLTDLQFLSDYKEGTFGRSTGMLVTGSMLLARSVVLVDREGVVRYIQVVPELTRLPDMDRAFKEAMRLAQAK
jgi:thiol peroxidase